MRVSWMLWCAVWAWAWRGVPWVAWAEEASVVYANDCEVYGGKTAASPVKEFHQRTTVSLITSEAQQSNGQINIKSSSTGETCQLFLISKTVMVQCRGQQHKAVENSDVFSAGAVTDIWISVEQGSKDKTSPAWDLKVVERRGRHRAHLLAPDTRLQPPITLQWGMLQNIQYYYNCITGCLFQKSVQLPKGVHTFFLRHDEDFTQLNINCSILNREDTRKMSINVTADDLGPPGGLKEIRVAWSPSLGRVVVLVDGIPEKFTEPLDEERQVNVTVEGGGGGLVSACDPRFQTVAGEDQEVITTELPTVAPPPSNATATTNASTAAITDQEHPEDHSAQCLTATFILVLLNLLATIGAIILATLLYFRSSEKTTVFSHVNGGVLATFSRRLSTRSSTRSQHQGSQRRNKNQNETQTPGKEKAVLNCSGETRATSETVNIPLTTPDAQAGQRQKVLCPDSLVDLDLN